MEKIRSFIAIELPQDLKARLGRLQSSLKVERPRVKWVSPDGIHLTLKFLGDVDASRISQIAQAMTEAVKGIQPFELTAGELGVFPNPNRVQVVWVGLEGDLTTLDRLYRQLEEKIAASGFQPEKRDFKAHLTLARVADEALPEERKRFGDLISKSTADVDFTVKVSGLSLMKSVLTPRGALYSRLAYVSLTLDDNII